MTFPVFNDVLTFLWCKMKLCPRDTLIQVTKSFYKREEVVVARDLLYDMFPGNENRRVKHRKSEDDLKCMYNVLQEIDSEDPPIFATKDLNNIPCVDLKNIDGVSLICKQSKLEDQVQELIQQQAATRIQLAELTEYIQKNFLNKKSHQVRRESEGDFCAANHQLTAAVTQSSLTAPSPTPVNVDEMIHSQRLYSQAVSRSIEPSASTTPTSSTTPKEKDVRISSNYVRDNEGFIRREKSRPSAGRRPLLTGTKNGTKIKVALSKCHIFVSRLAPEFPIEELREFVQELTGSTSIDVEKLNSKYPTYSSFVITCEKSFEKVLLDPDEWEKGVIIRPFYGKSLRKNNSEPSRESLSR